MQNITPKEKFIYKPSIKDHDAIPMWFCFPSTYSIGMSSLGYLSLFKLLDQKNDVDPERIFVDTIHTSYNIRNIELMSFSVSFELDFIGIFNILSKYNIPFRSSDRDTNCPIIFGGGPVLSSNPEPYADFFDVILIGEGEEILLELVEKYKEIRHVKDRKEQLALLSQIEGLYVPSLYDVEYNQDNTISSITKNDEKAPEILTKRYLSKMNDCIYSPITTEKSMFGDMFLLEVARGCPRRCKFCLASYLTLPARYPDFEEIKKAIDIGVENSPKIGLLGALIADHPQFDQICNYIQEKLKHKNFEVSVSSLRADGITDLIASTLVKGGQHQATIAVEAGSERLRKVINKHLSNDDIFKSVKTAHEQGLSGLKIYGIIGLPTETEEDMDELVDLMAVLKKENK